MNPALSTALSTTTMHRLSSGKLVSDRIVELLDEVSQRGLVAAEIVLGSRAMQLLRDEIKPMIVAPADDYGPKAKLPERSFFHDVEVSESLVEAAEYVGIDAHY